MTSLDRLMQRFARFNQANCNDAWRGIALKQRFRPAILEGLARLCLFTFREARASRLPMKRGGVAIIVGTQNNYNSAKAALGERPDARFIAVHNFASPDCTRINLLSQYLTGLWILLVLPVMLLFERRSHVRMAMVARLDQLVLTFGWGRGIRAALRESQYTCVAVTSCLTVHQNLVVEQARAERIPTLFITHAPIGRGQMALTTDYAFLDGEFQREVFPVSNTRYKVTGSGRGQALSERRADRSHANGIVIATNSLIPDLAEIEDLIDRLRLRYDDLPVVVRPHPRDRERFAAHRELCQRTGSRYHHPSRPLGEEMEDCRFLATCQSGVVIDALLLGFYPLILRSPTIDAAMGDAPADYYGYRQFDLVRDLEIDDPRLPASWSPMKNTVKIDLAAQPGWDSRKAISRELDAILANEASEHEAQTRATGRG